MESTPAPAKKSRLTLYIVIALVLGIAVGFVLNKTYLNEANQSIAEADVAIRELSTTIANEKDSAKLVGFIQTKNELNQARNASLSARDSKVEPFSLLADIFLRLIKMIVAPLVFTTLVVGVAKLGDINSVGRIGGKTLLWFLGASFMSLLLGMLMVNLFQPGIAMNLPLPTVNETGIQAVGLSLKTFLHHIFPSSVIESMAKNEILQIVVFSIFFGVSTAAIGEQGKMVIKVMDALAHVILKLTGYVMNFAPVAVFRTIVRNLISNALKYHNPHIDTPFLKILIQNNVDHAVISVADNGIGIEDAHLYKIFGMFFRATEKSKGTGLGLYIVKSMVDKLGGQIQVTSRHEEGTTFSVELPRLLFSDN